MSILTPSQSRQCAGVAACIFGCYVFTIVCSLGGLRQQNKLTILKALLKKSEHLVLKIHYQVFLGNREHCSVNPCVSSSYKLLLHDM